jgi:hypothetical protein
MGPSGVEIEQVPSYRSCLTTADGPAGELDCGLRLDQEPLPCGIS